MPEMEVVAVADDNKSGLAKALERTGAQKSYLNFREMLEKERPEIVSISQRWIDQHHDMALAAAEFGCHVYMEKPFCRTLKEADEIISALESKHLKLAIAHTTRYAKVLPLLKKMVEEGEIGTLLEIRGRGKEDRRGGGEDLWVLGSHICDLMRYFNGDVASCTSQVYQEGRPVTSKDVYSGNEGIGALAGDALYATFDFFNGPAGYFASYRNQAGAPTRFGITLCGSKGLIQMSTGPHPKVYLLKDSSWPVPKENHQWQPVTSAGIGQPEPAHHGDHNDGNRWAIQDLVQAIETDGQPISSMYDARAATEMIVGVFESHRQQARVPFPLENRENPLTMLG